MGTKMDERMGRKVETISAAGYYKAIGEHLIVTPNELKKLKHKL